VHKFLVIILSLPFVGIIVVAKRVATDGYTILIFTIVSINLEPLIGSDIHFLVILTGTPEAVTKSLQRLKSSGMIIRIAHGIYYYPKIDKEYGLGIIPPTIG